MIFKLIMGCIASRFNRRKCIFDVINVDDKLEDKYYGKMEITESEIIYHQEKKSPTIWPLRSLRRYGCDGNIFTFECGRRCATGTGIYAFKCNKSKKLFDIVNEKIANNTDTKNLTNNGDIVGIAPMNRRLPSQVHPEGYLNTLAAPNLHMLRSYPNPRQGSVVVSPGPISPPAITPPYNKELDNNNYKRGSLISNNSFTYTNTSALDCTETQAKYANLMIESTSSGIKDSQESMCRLYMNVDTKDVLPSPSTTKDKNLTDIIEVSEDDIKHCYANINAKDIEKLRSCKPSLILSNNLPQTSNILKVNYAKLDFDIKDESITSQNQPDSPSRPKESYAVIDFYRTNALSQSINPTINDTDDGIKKLRHNSTISDVITRTSTSMSD